MNTTSFHDFWFGMPTAKRPGFASKVGTTEGYLERVAGGYVLPSFGLATRLVRASRALRYESIVATYEARNGRLT